MDESNCSLALDLAKLTKAPLYNPNNDQKPDRTVVEAEPTKTFVAGCRLQETPYPASFPVPTKVEY